MANPESRHLMIYGRVQGVGYRAAMMAEATRLGICGWVRNRIDGCVEAVVTGSPDAVAAVIAWSRKGPPAAKVDRVEVSMAPAQLMQGFEARTTL